MSGELNQATGRPFGDHGTAQDAIDFLMAELDNTLDRGDFIEDWTHGDLDAWPEFYDWLNRRAVVEGPKP